MQNEIIINVGRGETRVALLERSAFSELHIEREIDKSVVGNIVKARVSRVLPGMQAAFVDIGLEKAAFLYVGDYFSNALGDGGNDDSPSNGRRGKRGPGGRRQPPKIETVLSEGEEIVVQIAKAPIGTKGARITSNISIPGRHLVLTPWSRRVGVSRRIGATSERKRLREIVERLRPKDLGFIIRTAGDGVREADLEADIKYLNTIWQKIVAANAQKTVPAVLHEEHDLPVRIIRDFANSATRRIATDSKDVFDSMNEFVEEFVAEPRPDIELYDGSAPLFEATGIEAQIHANLERKVPLKSGGSLVFDQCEALTAIDVNTGRFVGKRDLEETVFKTNLEAVKEVVNQLRFRNIGGLIIIDLIDMESADHREKVYLALQDALRSDKARTNCLKISELGLVEMTRKRTRENLRQTLCEPCPQCEGRGFVLSKATVSYNILREIQNGLPRFCGRQIAITVHPRIAAQLLGPEKETLTELSASLGREVEVRARPTLNQEQFEIEALDQGPPATLELSWLRDPAEIAAEEAEKSQQQSASRKASKEGRGRGSRRKRGRRGGPDDDEAGDDENESNGETVAAGEPTELAAAGAAAVVAAAAAELDAELGDAAVPDAASEVEASGEEDKEPDSPAAEDDRSGLELAEAPPAGQPEPIATPILAAAGAPAPIAASGSLSAVGDTASEELSTGDADAGPTDPDGSTTS